jgi:hypothetical protein
VQDFWPDSPEAWKFAALVFTTTAPGVGFLVKMWADRKIATANKAAKATADAAVALEEANRHIRDTAERREAAANERADKALGTIAALTEVATEQSHVLKATFEEVRRVGSNVDVLLRDRR